MKGARLVVMMWLIALALLSWHYIAQDGRRPPASAYGGAGVIYSILVALAAVPGAEPLAGVFAVGWTLALVWRMQQQQQPTPKGGGKKPKPEPKKKPKPGQHAKEAMAA